MFAPCPLAPFRKTVSYTHLDAFHDRIKELVNRYEMEDQDDIWLCTQMLKRIGVDVEAWHKESEHGT